jgi:4-hydroxy-tetrahydrodipicolinate synthase
LGHFIDYRESARPAFRAPTETVYHRGPTLTGGELAEETMALNLNGLIPATVLPMDADGRIDEPALRSYIAWVAAQGPVALAINVDTGEGPHLTHDEKVRILQVVNDVTDVPIVAGLAGPSTEAAVRQAKDFKAAGADAFLVFPIPAYLSEPLDPRVPVQYHEAIAQVGLPLILFQLQPALAGLNFEPDTLRVMASVEGVVAIKEASFDARRFVDTARLLEELPRKITLLTGNDNFILESFMLGATGALIGFGAVMTQEQVDMIRAWQDGRIDEARELGRRVQRLADVVFARPVGDYRVRLKECLRILGVLENAHVRKPLLPISDEERAFLAEVLAEVGLLPASSPEPVGAAG